MSDAQRIGKRKNREWKRRERGDRTSYIDEYENAAMIVAHLRGYLSEGQVARALGTDRLGVRAIADQLTDLGETMGNALFQEVKQKGTR